MELVQTWGIGPKVLVISKPETTRTLPADATKQFLERNNYVYTCLCSPSFRVIPEVGRVRTVRYNILRHPLISILPALSSYSRRLDNAHKAHLQPLIVISGSDAPWPAVVQAAVPWRQVVIVIRRCWEMPICDTLVLETKRKGATSCVEELTGKCKLTVLRTNNLYSLVSIV